MDKNKGDEVKGMETGNWSVAQHAQVHGFIPQHQQTGPSIACLSPQYHTCNLSAGEVEAGGSEDQGYL